MPELIPHFDRLHRPPIRQSAAQYAHDLEREWIGLIGEPARAVVESVLAGAPQRPGIDYCDRCGVTIASAREEARQPCAQCTNRRFAWQTLVRLGEYDGNLRECIHTTKFHAWDAMGLELGRRLGAQVARSPVEVDAIVPIPTPMYHRFRRGIDHTAIIALGVASIIKRPVVHALRKSSRPPQQTIAKADRRANVRGSFSKRRWHSVADCRALLIDDVATTGSTLKEACAVLRAGGAPISIDVAVIAMAGSL